MKQRGEVSLWSRHVETLSNFLAKPGYGEEAARLKIAERLKAARAELLRVSGNEYLEELQGSLGADPILLHNAPRVQPHTPGGEAQMFN